jgi:type IV pilus assembly protein PilW
VLSRRSALRQRGLSLVELMVGLTVGLLIVAAASMMMAGQLVENRRLLAAAQLQQDLRAAADIITRELRRSSRLSEKAVAASPSVLDTIDSYVGTSSTAGLVVENSLADISATNSNTEVSFGYVASDTGTLYPSFKFRWNTVAGTLQSDLGNGSGYQDLTDGNTIRITNFTVTSSNAGTTPVALPCARPCPSTSASPTACWPKYNVRWLDFTIAAESRADAAIKREIKGRVRVRADTVSFASAAPTQICP